MAGDGPVTSGLSLIFQVRTQAGGECPAESSQPNFPTSPPASPWQLWDVGCNNEEQQQPTVSAFSSWCSDKPLGSGRRRGLRGQRWGCQGRACYDLISVIVGHYVNCTSRLQFMHHASSVLSWLVFWKHSAHFPILYLCRGGQLSMVVFFQHLFCFAFTLSHSHMEAAQSTTKNMYSLEFKSTSQW